jgi:hypothetical protein
MFSIGAVQAVTQEISTNVSTAAVFFNTFTTLPFQKDL